MADGTIKFAGFPLADHAGETVTKADLFLVVSRLFRLCTMQNMAIRSLESGDTGALNDELSQSGDLLNELYTMLQSSGAQT